MKRLLPLLAICSVLSADIADDLIVMGRRDQDDRMALIQRENSLQGPDEQLRDTIRAQDQRHTEQLKAIIAEQGWPTKTLVGLEAANAAWLIAQHAKHDPAFMNQVLQLITPHVATGDVEAEWYALLTDRLLVMRGEPQLYATQYTSEWISGALQLTPSTPIYEPDHLAHRREVLGLSSHAEYLQQLATLITGSQE